MRTRFWVITGLVGGTVHDGVKLFFIHRSIPTSSAGVVQGAPATSTSTATTNIMVKNNQSAVIGGIYSGSHTTGTNRVPIVSDIPVLGWLFKSKSTEKSKTELVIFVTPRIIDSRIEDGEELAEDENPSSDFG